MQRGIRWIVAFCLIASCAPRGRTQSQDQTKQLAHDIFKQLIEKNGYFYGRGTEDMKEGDAILVTNFIRLKKEGYLPDRDLILALTADEEGGSSNGVDWLLREHRDWIDAEYCINLDGGEFEKDKDKRLLAGIQASEK